MVSRKQANGRGIRAYVQAAIRVDGEQGVCGRLNSANYRVSRPMVFLGRVSR